MSQKFVHLHLHSEFSLVDGTVRIKPLIAAVKDMGMPAVALTDRANMFALVRFYKAAMGSNVKPITGSEIWIRDPDDINNPASLVLLVKNDTGYKNLTRLVSRAFVEGQHLGKAMVDREWLTAEATNGLIALSAAADGEIGRALVSGNREKAIEHLVFYRQLFEGNFYLELQRTGHAHDEICVHESVALAVEFGLPVVATNNVRFLRQEDFQAHEIRVCIHDGRTLDDSRRPRNYTDQQYLRSAEEMIELFSDIPSAIENTVEIARRCSIELTLGKNFLPDFPIPAGKTEAEFFSDESRKGLEQRLLKLFPDEAERRQKRAVYDERLQIELDVINQMGFPGYFLIVADFIQWAKDNDVPVGPGRGSGAGSLVAYALKITDLDPIEHDLLFERFLNPERVSMPDFDVDFCMDKRDRVIDYVARKYGRESVSQIITYGSMAAKAVVRDVGRVLGHPYGFTDRVAKMIPFEIGITLDKALEESEELKNAYENDEEIRDLLDMARKLEGLSRNAGKHAGGVVISPTVLTDFAPLYCEPGGENLVTQFDKDDVEQVGLVKFDFLGLRTLTIIDWAIKNANRDLARAGRDLIDITTIPVDDKAAFDLLKACETTAVFQLESRGMKELIKKLQPDCFDDITALVALYRPGPLQSGMVDDFIARKHGVQEVVYPHPKLEPILSSTYGVILYQEQVMQIAQVLAGYSLGGADLLRRAMGKKKPEEMAKQGEIFRTGAVKNGVDEDTATYIFDLMEKFAGYGFNKSHSAAYALVSYQTMWMKAHYPAAFMAAVLSADMDNTDKVVTLIEECRSMKLQVNPPQVNDSEFMFTTDDEGRIIYGLGAIKGVGENAIESIVEQRKSDGKYHDLFDFCQRIDLKKVNRRVLESLIRAGALDQLGANRATLMAQLPLALKMAEQQQSQQSTGQNDLFGMEDIKPAARPDLQLVPGDTDEWDDDIRLKGEKETLGLYLTGHPIDRYETELSNIVSSRIANLSVEKSDNKYRRSQRVTIAGLVVGVSRRQTQKGSMMANVILDDRTARIEATLFSDAYEAFSDLLAVDRILVMEGSLSFDEFRGGLSLRVDRVQDMDEARQSLATSITLCLDQNVLVERNLPPKAACEHLAGLLKPYQGGNCTVRVVFWSANARCLMVLPEVWSVEPREELIRSLERFATRPNGTKVGYGPRPAPAEKNQQRA
jgi:DNA polymerase-3 subunit alpha